MNAIHRQRLCRCVGLLIGLLGGSILGGRASTPCGVDSPGTAPYASPVLQEKDWNWITKHCLDHVRKNQDKVQITTNESGFYRITIPVPQGMKTQVVGIRINYWGNNSQQHHVIESIHNHPNYFESHIVSGEFQHDVYKVSKNLDKGTTYTDCTLLKKGERKTVISKKSVVLDLVGRQTLKARDTWNVSKSLIHRIVSFQPGTLSINVVFGDKQNQRKTYDVFLSVPLCPALFIKKRVDIADQKMKRSILESIISILQKKVQHESIRANQ